jgi:hypothetical protein
MIIGFGWGDNTLAMLTVRTIEIDGPITNSGGSVTAQGTATWTDTCKAGSRKAVSNGFGSGFSGCLVFAAAARNSRNRLAMKARNALASLTLSQARP